MGGNVSDRLSRLSSQWPSAQSVLKTVGGILFSVFVGGASYLFGFTSSSQVLLSEHTMSIKAVQSDVAGNATKIDRAEEHGRKIAEALHGINLTTQRLTDMVARHESDIDEIKSDAKDDRRRRRRQ